MHFVSVIPNFFGGLAAVSVIIPSHSERPRKPEPPSPEEGRLIGWLLSICVDTGRAPVPEGGTHSAWPLRVELLVTMSIQAEGR